MIAVASQTLEQFHDANRFFRYALRADPENLDAEVLWGDLFRQKYNDAEARKSYAAVLKHNPKHVPALVGMAKTLHGSAAQNLLEDALKVNASSESALEALAEIAIEDDRLDRAKAYLARILEINRESVNAQTLFAGPFTTDDESADRGSLRLIEFPDRATANRHVAEEPYVIGSVQKRWHIHRWLPRAPYSWRDCPRTSGRRD